MMPWPSGKVNLSTCGLMFVRWVAAMRPSMSISLSKWPMFPTMALFFIFAMSAVMMMPLFPVVVMKMSASETTDSRRTTRNPSMAACSAQIGSISVTYTTAPAAFMAWALPLPTSPKPQITMRLPASITSVARMIPSGRECLQPYRLSNLDLVTESFTLMAGKSSSPFFSIWYRRCTPVVVSSETPKQRAAILCQRCGSLESSRRTMVSTILNSALSVLSGSGRVPSLAKASSAL
mmetsp:Transcript_1586/g.6944  ORF Transcript_1586/g.6944 Transcript_1586/m.6944 type:complete len:235 (+) Transcript_1586:1874-2578(+)